MSHLNFLSISNVTLPIHVLTPSARVNGGYWGWIIPFSNDYLASLARYGSTPITTVEGLKKCVAKRVPLHNPPPPTGTTK